MSNFCPECGVKLEKDFRFCPSCGINLVNEINEDEGRELKAGRIVCKNCGEVNDVENSICSSCGIVLPHKPGVSKTQKKTRSGRSKSEKEINQRPGKVNEVKSINPKLFFTIFIVVALVAAVIIISSGVMDQPDVVQQNVPQTPANQQTVDLNLVTKINEVETQLKNNPGNAELLLELAHLQNDAGFYNKAIEDYKEYLQMNPKNADARVDMGVCYYNLGNYDTAIMEMKKALEYEPNHQIGHLNLGIVNLAAGNLNESTEWFRKAVEINPNTEIGKRAQELLKSHK